MSGLHVLVLHPVAQWSLRRVAAICARDNWRLTIVTIEDSTVGEGVAPLHEWIRVPALSDDADVLLGEVAGRRFDGVAAGNEFAVIAADVLARELGLPHNNVDLIRASRDKGAMRKTFARVGVPQPAVVCRVRAAEHDIDWDHVSFPVITKPVDMAMSMFVRKCDSRADVESTLASMAEFTHSRLTNYSFDPHALIEEYVEGPEFSLDCVITDGTVVAHALIRTFLSPLPAHYEIGHLVGDDLPEHLADQVLRAMERISAGWGMANGVMHAEFKMTEDNFSLIEAAARPSGGHLPELIEFQSGLAMEDAYLHARLGSPWQPPPPTASGVWHGLRFEYPQRGPVSTCTSIQVVEAHGDLKVLPGAEPFSANGREGHTILRSSNRSALARELSAL